MAPVAHHLPELICVHFGISARIGLVKQQLQLPDELVQLCNLLHLLLLLLFSTHLVHLVGHQTREQREESKGANDDVGDPHNFHNRVLLVDYSRWRRPIIASQKEEEGLHGGQYAAKLFLHNFLLFWCPKRLPVLARDAGDDDGVNKHDQQEQHRDPHDALERGEQTLGKDPQLLEVSEKPEGPEDPRNPQHSKCHHELGHLILVGQKGPYDPCVHNPKYHNHKVEYVPTPVLLECEELAFVSKQAEG
mmetsp:Transcript_103146/g.300819  ORF Transcript_103146/g.300819 Transcript_103146/m.300819 type:complete len:248 (+) Transcript_103146:525-1268(+)